MENRCRIWFAREAFADGCGVLEELRSAMDLHSYGSIHCSCGVAHWSVDGDAPFLLFDGRRLTVGADGCLPNRVRVALGAYDDFFWGRSPNFERFAFAWFDTLFFSYPMVADVVGKTVIDGRVALACRDALLADKWLPGRLPELSHCLSGVLFAGMSVPFEVVAHLVPQIAGLLRRGESRQYTLEHMVVHGLLSVFALLRMVRRETIVSYGMVEQALCEMLGILRGCGHFSGEDLEVIGANLRKVRSHRSIEPVLAEYGNFLREEMVFRKLKGCD